VLIETILLFIIIQIYFTVRYKYSILYLILLQVLRNAKEGDTITFHLLFMVRCTTTILIINNLKTTKAHTIMIAESSVYQHMPIFCYLGMKLS